MVDRGRDATSSVTAVSGADPGNGPLRRAARPKHRRTLGEFFEAYALLGLLIAGFVFFSVYPKTAETFLSGANIRVLLSGQAVVAVVALALLIPLCTEQWDLSVGATAGLAAVYGASVMSNGLLIGIAAGIGVGILVGTINALIVTRLNVDAVIATLGMLTIIAGIVQLKTNGLSIVGDIPGSLTSLSSGSWFGIPPTVVILGLIALAVYYVLELTPYGRYLYAIGSNPTAAHLVGLRIRLIRASTFVIAGIAAGCAGILAVATSGGADPSLGPQLLLPAFAAAFLSAASIKPGRYNVGGLLVAVYFLAVLNSGLNLAGAPPYISSFVNGTALIVGVALATYLGRKRRRDVV